MKKIAEMWDLAHYAHGHQMYGNKPYTAHLERVESIALALYPSESDQLVAIGHDLLEDTTVTYSHLLNQFGFDVADAIKAMTKQPGQSRLDYIQRVLSNPIATRVKKADAIANLTESVLQGDASRIRKYSALLEILSQHV